MSNGTAHVSPLTAVMAILTAISITVAVVIGIAGNPSATQENRERIIVLETKIDRMSDDIQEIKQAVVK